MAEQDILALDGHWRAAHPLPRVESMDKYARGRVLVVGGSRRLPGTILLPAEAAFRAGAGKVRVGTVTPLIAPLGLRMPESGMVALAEDEEGEIAASASTAILDQLGQCDTLVFGPAMAETTALGDLLTAILGRPRDDLTLLLDAAVMLTAARDHAGLLAPHCGRVVMTPNPHEMAHMIGWDLDDIAARPAAAAREAADRLGTVIALKDRETFVTAPDRPLLRYESGCKGLGTAGSGDVLAGLIGGLMARGADPLAATGWGVWLHGEAGRAAAARIGDTGFLARELLPELPRLVSAASS